MLREGQRSWSWESLAHHLISRQFFHWVDAYKGMELCTMKLSYPVTHAFGLPLTDSSEQKLHLFIDDQAQAHLLPGSEESLETKGQCLLL
jgi:hypothetical protein